MLLGGSVGLIAFQLERVRAVGDGGTPFASAWEQRVEVLSFMMLPPNLIVLAPSVLVAAWAAQQAGRERGPTLTFLLRVNAAIAATMAGIGVVSIATIIGDGNGAPALEAIYLRLGGISLAIGLFMICRLADRLGGPREPDQLGYDDPPGF